MLRHTKNKLLKLSKILLTKKLNKEKFLKKKKLQQVPKKKKYLLVLFGLV